MSVVKPKKKLGQHFLTDQNIARKIVDSLDTTVPVIVAVGPGMGVLTRFLLQHPDRTVFAIEIDPESVSYLQKEFPEMEGRIIAADFLRWDTTCHPFSASSATSHTTYLPKSFSEYWNSKTRYPKWLAWCKKR